MLLYLNNNRVPCNYTFMDRFNGVRFTFRSTDYLLVIVLVVTLFSKPSKNCNSAALTPKANILPYSVMKGLR